MNYLPAAVLTSSYNQFSLDVYRQVASSSDSNVFLCTYSILTALSMCLPGARDNTEKQLKQLMNFQNLSNQDVYHSNLDMLNYFSSNNLKGNLTMNMANRVYTSIGFSLKKDFTDVLQTYFKSSIEELDFSNQQQSTQTINNWVEEQTANKIKDLLSPNDVSAQTKMILVNAIYFKGNWLKKFNENLTEQREFHLLDGTRKSVDMMYREGKYKYLSNPNGLKASVCEFPYAGEQISMTVILPNEDVHISEIESQLANHEVLKNILELQLFKNTVKVYLPKLKLEEEVELSGILTKMGVSDAFNPAKANFSGMSDLVTQTNNLFISKVVHKSIINVNEESTEAAGATGVVIALTSVFIGEIPVFKCDRPFLFVLHDTTRNNILFIGRYVKP